MPKYIVSASVTVSVWTEVEADTAEQARELAEDRPMQSLCHRCGETRRGQEREEWRTSGELDGTPSGLRAEGLDD